MSETTHSSDARLISFLILFLTNCWLWMQGIHEFGHVVGAVVSSGHVQCVVWHIAAISRTDVAPNPHPLLVCWAGPILGSVLPLFAHQLLGRRSAGLAFFAAFCLVANGAYISIGSIDRIGDAGELLRQGSPTWLLWLTGLMAIIAGIGIWHRMGNFRQLRSWPVSRRNISVQAAVLASTLIAQILLFQEQAS